MNYSPDAVLRMIDILQEIEARYLVTGSLATNVYRPPRSTNDADFVVDLAPDRLSNLFKRMEPDFEQEPQMAFETVTRKLQHRFYYRKTSFLIEVFEARLDDAHERARFERSLIGNVEGRTAFIPTAEDIIIQKLRWYKQIRRSKDYDDIVEVLVFQKLALDWAYIEGWCRQHSTSDLLEKARHEATQLLNHD